MGSSRASSSQSATSVSSFNLNVSLRSSSSCLRLPPHLILPSIFSLVTCFRRPFLSSMWLMQLAFLLFLVCRIFHLYLILYNNYSFLSRSVQLIFIFLQRRVSEHPRYLWYIFRSVQVSAPYESMVKVFNVLNSVLPMQSGYPNKQQLLCNAA